MSAESEARTEIARILRRSREQKGWGRNQLAERVGLKREVIIRLEHAVQNPSRRDFMRIIKVLGLPPKEREEAGRLLRVIYPERRVKFHLPSSILRHCNRYRW